MNRYYETLEELVQWADHAGEVQIERDMEHRDKVWRVTFLCMHVWGPALGEDADCEPETVSIEAGQFSAALRVAKFVWDAAQAAWNAPESGAGPDGQNAPNGYVEHLEAKLNAAESEVARLAADAKRLDWLESHDTVHLWPCGGHGFRKHVEVFGSTAIRGGFGRTLREAIDDASNARRDAEKKGGAA